MKKILLSLLLFIFLFTFVSADLFTPTSYWRFNENGFPAVFNDTSGNLNLTTNTSVFRIVNGKLSNAVRINNSVVEFARNSTAIPNNLILDSNPFTIAFWINASNGGGGTGYNIFGRGGNTPTRWAISTMNGNNNVSFAVNSVSVITSPNSTLNSSYNRVVFVREGTSTNQFKVYINGVNTANATLSNNLSDNTQTLSFGTANGGSSGYNLDDIRIYNGYAWSLSDISKDFNANSGLQVPVINISLIYPTPNIFDFNTTLTFNSSIIMLGNNANLTNATLLLYSSSNSLINQTSINLTGNRNQTQFNIIGLSADTYSWSMVYCFNISNNNQCSVTNNNTFNYGFKINSETFQSVIGELTSNTMTINITALSGNTLSSSSLVYNGSSYSGSISYDGSNYIVTRTLTSPAVSSNTNFNFNWIFNFNSGNLNSTTQTQTVYNIGYGSCGVHPILVANFSVFDEDLLTPITGQNANLTIQVYSELRDASATNILSSYAETFEAVNLTSPAQICIADGLLNITTYSMFTTVAYNSIDHEPETYVYQNVTLSNLTVPYLFNLYELATTNAQQFKITYLDNLFLPNPNLVIEIYRFYTGSGNYTLIEAPSTGVDGSTVASLVLNDIVYRFVVKQNNQTIYVADNKRMFCSSAITECTYEIINFDSGSQITNSQTFYGVTLNPNYNSSSQLYSLEFSSSNTKTISINITLNEEDTQICYNSLTANSGTLTCQIPLTYFNQKAKVKVYIDGALTTVNTFEISKLDNATYGKLRILLAILIFLVMTTAFSSSKELMLFSAIFSLLISSWLYLLDTGSKFGSDSPIIWLIVFVVIMIAHFGRRR